MSEFYLTLFFMGLVITGLSLAEEKINRLPLTDPMVALISGILVGPHVFDWIDPTGWGHEYQVFHYAASLTIAMALMATALRLPRGYFSHQRMSMLTILFGGMILMWLFSSAIIYLVTGVDFLLALLIGAIITPTDPVVASSIVSGKVAMQYLPEKVRYFISAESGANDGLAFCIVLIPLLLITGGTAGFWQEWLLRVVLWENVVAIVLGYVIGRVIAVLAIRSLEKEVTDIKSFLAFTIAVGFMTLGLMEIIHCNGVIAVFAAGVGLGHKLKDNRNEFEAERVQEMMERLFTIPIFVLLGAALPWQAWADLGWTASALAVAILLLRRLPVMFILRKGLPSLNETRDLWFTGWFGPIGAAALFYAALSSDRTGNDIVWNIATLVIAASVIAHAVTAYAFTRKYSDS